MRHLCEVSFLFFFFQAEDGIRDLTVTGVQTCALPIYEDLRPASPERLARPEVDRHALPLPVVDEDLDGGDGFRARLRVDVWLLPVPHRVHAVGFTTADVLSAHRVGQHVLRTQDPYGVQHL